MTVDHYKDFKESYGTIMEGFPTIKKDGAYYFQEIDGMKTSLSAEKWEQIQKDIERQLIPDNEWGDCSELSARLKLNYRIVCGRIINIYLVQ